MRDYPRQVLLGCMSSYQRDTNLHELFAVEPSVQLVRDALEKLTTDATPRLLTIISTNIDKYVDLTSSLHKVADDEAIMIRELVGLDPAKAVPSDPSFRVVMEARNGFIVGKILQGDTVAASGQMMLKHGMAVFDRIVTQDAFRRKGLGSALMMAFCLHAVQSGAQYGGLIASEQGRLLYLKLGWTVTHRLLILANQQGKKVQDENKKKKEKKEKKAEVMNSYNVGI